MSIFLLIIKKLKNICDKISVILLNEYVTDQVIMVIVFYSIFLSVGQRGRPQTKANWTR